MRMLPPRTMAGGKGVAGLALLLLLMAQSSGALLAADALAATLRQTGFRLIHESYVDNNWDLFTVNADGTDPKNLTHTPDQNELYPQVSPDGTRICFVSDVGEGRDTVRSVWIMNLDGTGRRKIADGAREPFWSPDGGTIGYLPQEYPKFAVIDYYTKGMVFHDLKTGASRKHPNFDKLHHLYNPGFSPDGKWIVSTVHAGMGFGHAILMIEADGDGIYNLEISGCRPCFSPDGKSLAWGPGDHEIAAAELDFSGPRPKMGKRRFTVTDPVNYIYHVDWAPNGRFLSISRGPKSEGDPTKRGTHQAACEIVGVYAPGWDLMALPIREGGRVDLSKAGPDDFVKLTHDGNSNKESDWIPSTR